jgi:hypothetical protein
MRTPILLASLALLAASSATNAPHDVRGEMFVAQGMTGSAGSNPATTAVSPRTDPGPDPTHDAEGRAPRTSLDNGSSSPLAGDEADQARPNANARRDGASTSPTAGAPSSRDRGR